MRPAIRRFSARQRLFVAALVLVVGFAVGLAFDPKGLSLWLKLSADERRLDTENAQLRAQVDDLRRQARALEGDPAALERAARESGYVRDDEILFELR